MREKDIISMNIKELKKLNVINKVLDKRLKQKEAALLLNLSERQVRRIVKRVKQDGEMGIIHQGRGKSSNRMLPSPLRETVIKLYEEKYRDFGPTLATEKLEEIDKINMSRETLRKWLLEADLWKKKRKARTHLEWRKRKEHFGEMVLLDGSHHDWLEGRGEEFVLMGYVDDATGICHSKFYDYEGTLPAMDSFKEYIKTYGIPLSIYVDKHSTYLSNKKLTIEEELQGVEKPLSQFERACKELGVEVIHANSPQAKGRIERKFGVFQDRLVKEMRLACIKTKEQANDFLPTYLPKHNEKFSVKPANKDDFHVKAPARIDLEKILCLKTTRRLRNDNTISFGGKLYLIEDRLTSKIVNVEVRTDGSIHLSCRGQYLNYKQVEVMPNLESLVKPKTRSDKKLYIPPADHPWRNMPIKSKSQIKQGEVLCLTPSTK